MAAIMELEVRTVDQPGTSRMARLMIDESARLPQQPPRPYHPPEQHELK